ncbi:hypothetical protein KFE25_003747 [Diacronema lutheri]|uniref:NADH:ubiquinone oxidoreductase intermediate-associated protein 30 domain-containing protein n=2 Tax=Diacronema lutheri TaxID=2081491 RepID=A0A8J5X1W3_DIALT|nr:hypothetical protein KFE25_003747 [Diacronema lutheri]
MAARICVFLALSVVRATAVTDVPLLTWDGADATAHAVRTVDDPVMGGGSVSAFRVDAARALGLWEGEVKVVSFLRSPGFCTMRTMGTGTFPDASGTSALELRLRASSGLRNFTMQVGVAGVTTDQTVFSAHFQLEPGAGRERSVRVPWSAFQLTTRGQPRPGPPLSEHLGKINRVGLGTSGTAGRFAVELEALVAAA